MSEYIKVDIEYEEDPDWAFLRTNLDLAPDGPEDYPDRESGESGSSLAQFLFEIEKLDALSIKGGTLRVRRGPDCEWHALIDAITEALKEFFL